jgi:hypothetical protein
MCGFINGNYLMFKSHQVRVCASNSLKAAVMAVCLLVNSALASNFGEDADFLKQHTSLVVLADPTGQSKVAVAPGWQGRVMTSTAQGDRGASFGWINHELIASGKLQPHINAFGGEDRFWLGPEGGQFALFFVKGAPFDLAHWQTPAAIDTLPYPVVSQSADSVKVAAQFSVTNYSGTRFDVKVERTVRLLDADATWKKLGLSPAGKVKLVAYESENTLTNAGNAPWTKETGLLSIWILGQFNPSPSTTIVVPFKAGPESELGVKVTSNYFGEIPPERLKVADHVIYFSGDGKFRSKIGINPRRSNGVLGSYNAERQVLTLVQFNQPAGVTDYVNSLWKVQEHPYAGDAANSYNDGPPSPGAKPLGPFYEMESSSPAAALQPAESVTHFHTTMHLSGSKPALDAVARAILGVSLENIRSH